VRGASPRNRLVALLMSAQPASSFAKSLFCGEIHEEMVFPWPEPEPAEQEKVRALVSAARKIGEHVDPRKVEERRWLGDDLVRELGDAGLCGLYVPERYGGQGLMQTGYARLFETFARIDATLSIVMGVHQSIGFKGIHLFGIDEQKERLLPDLAAGRNLAGFALTEPKAGSDAYNLESRADRQPDGAWVLNGEKRYIGNGGAGSVVNSDSRWPTSSSSRTRSAGWSPTCSGWSRCATADSTTDIYAQIAVLSRVTRIFEDQRTEPSGQERYIAETFCTRAARRVRARFSQIGDNDDDRMSAIAKLAYKRGAYGYALFEDWGRRPGRITRRPPEPDPPRASGCPGVCAAHQRQAPRSPPAARRAAG
jgi:Acyl-CoA dehydrogenase, N-terminal domain/Acyl-CoA dehydrogenase, middle domain